MTSHEQARAELIEALERCIVGCRERLAMRRGVIALHNTVVRTSPGLYLVPKGNGYGVGLITAGVVMWGPSDARIQADYTRGHAGAEQAQAVPYVTALGDEIAECERLLASLQPVAA